jgi:hypothetical protein
MPSLSRRLAGAALLLGSAGGAVRQPHPASYRLVRNQDRPVLVPPGVSGPDLKKRRFTAPAGPARAGCAEVQRRGRNVRVTVGQDALRTRPPGWLSTWTGELEERGCVAPGAGANLAARIVEGLPLPPAAPFHLLYASNTQAGFAGLAPGKLELVLPVWREGTPPDVEPLESVRTTGNDTQLTLEVKASPALLGYDRVWYGVQPNPAAAGFRIVFLAAERHVQGTVQARDAASAGCLHFDTAPRFYRLLYKSRRANDLLPAIVLGAPTRAALDTATRAAAGADSCAGFAAGTCALIPKHVAINAYIVVTVNGRETPLAARSSVADAIRAGGERNPAATLPRLTLTRPYAGRPAPVEFERCRRDVLDLTLAGGESVSWR